MGLDLEPAWNSMLALAWGSTWALHGHTSAGGWAAARGLAGRAAKARSRAGPHTTLLCCVFFGDFGKVQNLMLVFVFEGERLSLSFSKEDFS